MIIILDNMRSIHNVGSIFRTADAAGIEKIYLCGITPAPIDRFGRNNTQLTKVSLGAEHSVPWEKVVSTASLIAKLKKVGFSIIAVEQDAKSIPYRTLRINKKMRARCALIMGNEVKGIFSSLLKKCDTIIEIPMHGKKESLNVGVSFGIVVFHLMRS